jgi:hypothetical protein
MKIINKNNETNTRRPEIYWCFQPIIKIIRMIPQFLNIHIKHNCWPKMCTQFYKNVFTQHVQLFSAVIKSWGERGGGGGGGLCLGQWVMGTICIFVSIVKVSIVKVKGPWNQFAAVCMGLIYKFRICENSKIKKIW